jgi:hypothetical protein
MGGLPFIGVWVERIEYAWVIASTTNLEIYLLNFPENRVPHLTQGQGGSSSSDLQDLTKQQSGLFCEAFAYTWYILNF